MSGRGAHRQHRGLAMLPGLVGGFRAGDRAAADQGFSVALDGSRRG
ncbi:hypothetical protein YT1_5338 [Rhodococcus ruber]|nr:hypothetical protein YT1_5338 [Rhodococcus ruber]